jgi:hypothetical protein
LQPVLIAPDHREDNMLEEDAGPGCARDASLLAFGGEAGMVNLDGPP